MIKFFGDLGGILDPKNHLIPKKNRDHKSKFFTILEVIQGFFKPLKRIKKCETHDFNGGKIQKIWRFFGIKNIKFR